VKLQKNNTFIFFFILLLNSFESFSFVQSKSIAGQKLYLEPRSAEIIFDYNLTPLELDTSAVNNFFENFKTILSNELNVKLVFNEDVSGSKFSIETSSDTSLFSSNSVAAITQISSDSFGEIIGAKIIINLNNQVSSEPLDYNYFGNIIAHEVGHSFGLDHSTAWASTMTPFLNPGQYTWEPDDITGGRYILDKQFEGKGEISGRFVGGEYDKKIYGVVVDLVEIENMRINQSTISNKRGEFKFLNVDKSKKYFIFHGPFNFSSAYQKEYLSVYNNFCFNNTSYEYTALSSCLNTENDGPHLIDFESSSIIDLGNIGIKCDLTSSEALYDYFINGESEINLFEKIDFRNQNLFLSGVIADEREITIPLSFKVDSADEFLNVSLISQMLRSPVVLSGTILNKDNGQEYRLGNEKLANVNGEDIPMSEGLPSYDFSELVELKVGENNFELKLESFYVDSIIERIQGTSLTDKNFHFSPGSKTGSFIIGLVVGKLDNSGKFIQNVKNNTSVSSNDFSCSSAVNSFEVSESLSDSASGSNNFSTGGGCSVIAGEQGVISIDHYLYFILEILCYGLLYCAIRRLGCLI